MYNPRLSLFGAFIENLLLRPLIFEIHKYSLSEDHVIVVPQKTTEVIDDSFDISFELELLITTLSHTGLIVENEITDLIYLVDVLLLFIVIYVVAVYILVFHFMLIYAAVAMLI